MGFRSSIKIMEDKIEARADYYAKKAYALIGKSFLYEDPQKIAFTSQQLLSFTTNNIRTIAGNRLLAGLKTINSRTTKLYISHLTESDGTYDGLNIATATIDNVLSRHPKLSYTQYKVCLKGLINGEDDYGQTSVYGKYEINLFIDEHAEYVIESVSVTQI